MLKKKIILLILRFICLILFPISYIVDPKYSGEITFFTVQSNLIVLIVMTIFSVFDILILCGKEISIPEFLYKIKHIGTTAILITFTVFGVILTPVLITSNFEEVVLSYSSIIMHQFIPIIAIIDWLLDEYDKKISYAYTPLPLSFSLYYFIFVLICSNNGVTFPALENGVTKRGKFPYFFLDYEKYGWFRTDGKYMGVVYWLILITFFVILISALLILIKNLRLKHMKK